MSKEAKESYTKKFEVTDEQAGVLVQLGMAQIHQNDRARAALRYYLEGLLEKPEINDAQAKAVLNILQKSTVTVQRELCDKVLAKYLTRFDTAVQVINEADERKAAEVEKDRLETLAKQKAKQKAAEAVEA